MTSHLLIDATCASICQIHESQVSMISNNINKQILEEKKQMWKKSDPAIPAALKIGSLFAACGTILSITWKPFKESRVNHQDFSGTHIQLSNAACWDATSCTVQVRILISLYGCFQKYCRGTLKWMVYNGKPYQNG